MLKLLIFISNLIKVFFLQYRSKGVFTIEASGLYLAGLTNQSSIPF